MTKNNLYTIIGVIIAVLFIGASIAGVKFPIGTTILHDSSTAILTINKNLYVGGTARVSNILFKELSSTITEDISGMLINSDALTMETQAGNNIMYIDSSSGLNLSYGNLNVDNYTALGSGNVKIKMKLITGVLPDTTNKWKDYAHGLTARSRILGIQWSIRDDSLSKTYVGGYNQSNPVLTGFLVDANNTNISYFLPNLSVNLKRDTIIFLVTYKE